MKIGHREVQVFLLIEKVILQQITMLLMVLRKFKSNFIEMENCKLIILK